MCVAWGLKKWLRAIRSFHPIVTIMLSFTLEGDRWRVAGTFDTGTLQQEFDRPSCKRSSLLLYLFFLFLTISFFLSSLSLSLSISISFLFALCVTRPFARSQLSFNPFAFTRFLFYRLSLSLLSSSPIYPTLFFSSSPFSCIKCTSRERGMSIICKVHFASKSESWKLQIYPVPKFQNFLSLLSRSLLLLSSFPLSWSFCLSIYVYFPLSTLYCSTIG